MKSTQLFEVSWEVCNKVGGIYTVLATKAKYAVSEFGENYITLGPDLGNNSNFIPENDSCWDIVKEKLEAKKIYCRFGRWDIEGQPKAILVSFKESYDSSKLLFNLWQDFGVDSFGGKWEYIEPVMFSTACAEVIEIIKETMAPNNVSIAHFHEWMCGAGLLYLKKNCPEISTVFTTHATVLGRSLAGTAIDVYAALDHINADEEAKRFQVGAKHSLEKTATREADCFTTVSEITAYETTRILNRKPDFIVFNGIDTKDLNKLIQNKEEIKAKRNSLLNIARKFLRKELADDTNLWITSGRYEVHNKGFDVLIESLSNLDKTLRKNPDSKPIVMLILVAAGHLGISDHSKKYLLNKNVELISPDGISTHRVHDEHNDQILKLCHSFQLTNSAENKINIIFSTAYLDGHDGVFDMSYYDVLSTCDLSIFPSFYEPWGYTPLESIGLHVPTITSDLAGFGVWAASNDSKECVSVLNRNKILDNKFLDQFISTLNSYIDIPKEKLSVMKKAAKNLALKADWHEFYPLYVDTYIKAKKIASKRISTFITTKEYIFTSYSDNGFRTPQFNSFTVIPDIPETVDRLIELAYNLKWSWDSEIANLFESINPSLFIECERNPVKFLFQLQPKDLLRISKDKDFIEKQKSVLKNFDTYMTRPVYTFKNTAEKNNLIAYFSLEYGLHESLPIYSGGLGVLAGDHLKTASDLNLPLIAVGLLYKQGYFKQKLNSAGEQLEYYDAYDFSQLPIKTMTDSKGDDLVIELPFPGRLLKARVWVAQVGKVPLYLLDADIQENAPQDRSITWKLYDGDKKIRLKQELLLGLGGVKLLEESLNFNPTVYHLNEGHSAFLLLERLKRFMDKNLNFLEAIEAVRRSSVFTTHTPVPAGHETYEIDMMSYYLEKHFENHQVLREESYRLGIKESNNIFSMTNLALRLSVRTNAVSKLHADVSKDMFKDFWEGFVKQDIPIESITNGVHVDTWIGEKMKSLFSECKIQWKDNSFQEGEWNKIKSIPNELIWSNHIEQKNTLLAYVKGIVKKDFPKRGEKPELIEDILKNLDSDVLIVGFARRFATYKRADLLFRNLKELSAILKDPNKPIVLIVAGKAHPSDKMGKDILKSIINYSRTEELKGHIVVLENYNMDVAKYLVQGVDVWLNTPMVKKEASGTSGMKAAMNGAINLSICDGWWYEAYTPEIGYGIEEAKNLTSQTELDQYDLISLHQLLKNDVSPTYYKREKNGFSKQWVEKMKNSMIAVLTEFNTKRMLTDYLSYMYCPTIEQNALLFQDDYKNIRIISDWKNKIRARFMSIKVEKLSVSGLKGDCLTQNQKVGMRLVINKGKMNADELHVQFVMINKNKENEINEMIVHNFNIVSDNPDDHILKYEMEYQVQGHGHYLYGVRIVPWHQFLGFPLEAGLIYWV